MRRVASLLCVLFPLLSAAKTSEDASIQPSGYVVLEDEMLDAAREAGAELMHQTGREHTLIGACIVVDAVTPSYKLWFRERREPVCIVRPWRVYTWMYDLDGPQTCACERWE